MKKTEIVLLLVLVLILLGCAQSKPATYTEIPFVPSSTPAPPPEVIHIEPLIIEPNPGPGPYTGMAMGYHGIVEVTLEVRDKIIISAVAVGDEETVGIGTLALDNMPPRMVEANSIVVDTISGATNTSMAVLDAAAKALGKAGLTDVDLDR
ncbi:MAG: FMN-binding protein [Spirochaetaceae bacterium]|jgi:hypothetical protein|nr:FMN-binding protein [Spirochaetaceae bacterium]